MGVRGLITPMIVFTYSYWLVALSVIISMMSAFTGLTLTNGLSLQSQGQKQLRIIMASIALGGGIWSMHFVAMLAMQFGIPVFYQVIETAASAFIAILLSGLALLILHFGRRTQTAIYLAGTILGLGIVCMHYVGLLAIEGCTPVFSPYAPIVAGVLAIGMGIAAIQIAYGRRTERNLLVATLMFGASVAVVHFAAMTWTTFEQTETVASLVPVLDNAQVAIFVLLSVFVISGAFLLSGASFFGKAMQTNQQAAPPSKPPEPLLNAVAIKEIPPPLQQPAPDQSRLPFEKDGKTFFVSFDKVLALHAEGHYTTAFLENSSVFCPWSITQAESAAPASFLRVHRSWLVNISQVQGLERTKDNGYCLFAPNRALNRAPVSRARINDVRAALGL